MGMEDLDRAVNDLTGRRLTRRQFLKQALALGAGLPGAVALLNACAPNTEEAPGSATATSAVAPSAAPDTPTYGGTLVLGYIANVTNMDPPRIVGQFNAKPWYAAYDPLVRLKHDNAAEVEPALAESWETSADGLTKVFNLRKGVTFHDGAPFNADAVVFNFMRIVDVNHPFHKEDMAPGVSNFRFIENVEAVDEYTVKMTLKAPAPNADQMLATYDGLMLDPATIQKWGDESTKHPNGTGPFKLTEWIEGDRMVFTRNDDYWAGKPYLDRLIIRTIPESATQLAELVGGNVHIVEDVTDPQNVAAIRANPDLVIHQVPGLALNWIGVNLTHPVLQDQRVREALSYAIDREGISQNLYQGLATVAQGWMPSGVPELVPVEYKYDPDKARQLLSDAGHGDGLEFKLSLPSTPTGPNLVGSQLGVVLQSQLEQVGVKINIETMETATFNTTLANGVRQNPWTEFDLWIDGITSIVADPDNFVAPYFRTVEAGAFGNYGHYEDQVTSDLITQAAQTVDTEERRALYAQIQERLTEFVPRVQLFQPSTLHVHRNNVRGFSASAANVSYGRLGEVWLAE